MDLNTRYRQRIDTLLRDISTRKARSRALVAAEIVTFLLFIGFIVLFTTLDGAPAWPLWLSALSLVGYLVSRRLDVRNSEAAERLKDLRTVNEHELQYLQGQFSSFDDGSRYADARHPFTFDLDIFGPGSLYQRVCRTVTTGGADELAARLSSVDGAACADGSVSSAAAVDRCADEVEALAAKTSWREAFMAFGQRGKIDSNAVEKALENMQMAPVSPCFGSRGVLVVACAAIGGLLAAVALAVAGMVCADLPIAWGVLQFFAVYALCAKPIRFTSKAVGRVFEPFSAYAGLLALIDAEMPDKKLADARSSFAQLQKILKALDRRGNVMGMMLSNMFFLSDLFLVRRFLRWQQRFVDGAELWMAEVAHVDALVSMATFRYNETQASRARVTDDEGVVYEGRGLWHPFLGAKAVRNDFSLQDRHFYIITGANMAGKSTFLRTLGINYVLAMNGMPVFAEQLTVSRFRLFTSMRTTDDLNHGISYFNAELLRLRQLVDSLDDRPTLIILDEILKGTNSLDKLNGSRMFLEWIARRNVTGVIATHDLELSKMADDRFHNYCFEIGLGDEVTYSYKVSAGVARNQNATWLLKKILT